MRAGHRSAPRCLRLVLAPSGRALDDDGTGLGIVVDPAPAPAPVEVGDDRVVLQGGGLG